MYSKDSKALDVEDKGELSTPTYVFGAISTRGDKSQTRFVRLNKMAASSARRHRPQIISHHPLLLLLLLCLQRS